MNFEVIVMVSLVPSFLLSLRSPGMAFPYVGGGEGGENRVGVAFCMDNKSC